MCPKTALKVTSARHTRSTIGLNLRPLHLVWMVSKMVWEHNLHSNDNRKLSYSVLNKTNTATAPLIILFFSVQKDNSHGWVKIWQIGMWTVAAPWCCLALLWEFPIPTSHGTKMAFQWQEAQVTLTIVFHVLWSWYNICVFLASGMRRARGERMHCY